MEGDRHLLFLGTIDQEGRDRARPLVVTGRRVEDRYLTAFTSLIGWADNHWDKRVADGVTREQLKRVVDRLPEESVRAGKDGSDHIHDLRETGDLYHIGMANETGQILRADQCVLKVVLLLQQMRRPGPVAIHGIAGSRPVPDIPL